MQPCSHLIAAASHYMPHLCTARDPIIMHPRRELRHLSLASHPECKPRPLPVAPNSYSLHTHHGKLFPYCCNSGDVSVRKILGRYWYDKEPLAVVGVPRLSIGFAVGFGPRMLCLPTTNMQW